MHQSCPSQPLLAAQRAAGHPPELNEDLLQVTTAALNSRFPDGAPLTRETMHVRQNELRASAGLPPLPLPGPPRSLRLQSALITAQALFFPVLLVAALVLFVLALIFERDALLAVAS